MARPGVPYSIWLEAEHWSPGQWVPRNANSDVLVEFADGARWTATFFSYENVAALRRKYEETGECLSGRYQWATNMVLVDELTRSRVEQVVEDLLASGEFGSAFARSGGAAAV